MENNVDNNISNNNSISKRVKLNKQMDLKTFFSKSRHYFIMTDGGKPIFSRYGDELENCGIVATFSAIIAKFTFFNTTSTSERVQ
jgi:hypothetical protein